MTTNPTPIPEPTALTSVVVGKRGDETVAATRMDGSEIPWCLRGDLGFLLWCSWGWLCDELTEIRLMPPVEVSAEINRLTGRIAELEAMVTHGMESRARLGARIAELEDAKPEPGPWLRGDELEAVMPTLKAGDVVEVDCRGYTATGKLWAHSTSGLSLWSSIVRTSDGNPGPYIDALRIIERAPEPEPEPGADIPNEVVEAALAAIPWASDHQLADVRAALAAADAKRAELDGGKA